MTMLFYCSITRQMKYRSLTLKLHIMSVFLRKYMDLTWR